MDLLIKDSCKNLTISDKFFNCEFNKTLIHQVILAYKSIQSSGICFQKNRSDVSGSGKKPWRQKGTGRARVGSIRSPIWRSGGVTFASKKKNYFLKINKKMYKKCIKSIFSELIRQNRLILIEDFFINFPKTSLLVNKIKLLNLDKVFIILDKFDENIFLASRNLFWVLVTTVYNINPVNLIKYNFTLVTLSSIKLIESIYDK